MPEGGPWQGWGRSCLLKRDERDWDYFQRCGGRDCHARHAGG